MLFFIFNYLSCFLFVVTGSFIKNNIKGRSPDIFVAKNVRLKTKPH